MRKEIKKNIFCLFRTEKKWLLLLFFLPLFAEAQYDSTEVVLSDTLVPEVIAEPPPPEEETKTYVEESYVDEAEKPEQYFLNKWETDEDSFIVKQRTIPDSLVKEMQQDDKFWYANTEIKKEEEKKKNSSRYVPLGQRRWFQALLWIVIIGVFAGFVMWYLMGNNVGLFRKKIAATTSDDQPDEIPEDIFAINYQKEIDKAIANGNYRLAVRLMFLRLLKQMAEKNVINYKQDRTNLDYLMQLHPTGYYNNFFRITRNYEYSWYGQFAVSEDAYTIIRTDFDQMDKQLK